MEEFKYNLRKLLLATNKNLPIKTIEKLLQDNYGIPVATFRKHRAIKKNEDKSIREDHLAIYAAFFNTSPSAIRNYELKADKTLKELRDMLSNELEPHKPA